MAEDNNSDAMRIDVELVRQLAQMLDELRRLVVPEAPREPHRLCDLLLFAFHACRRLDGRLLELRRAPLR